MYNLNNEALLCGNVRIKWVYLLENIRENCILTKIDSLEYPEYSYYNNDIKWRCTL